jgi:predicted nucleic acid-binding protein
MKTILVDVNVILDVLLDRRPHSTASAKVWSAIEVGRARGFVAAHAVTTIHYLIGKDLGASKAKRMVSAILTVFDVAAVDRAVLDAALLLPGPDFEDAVTVAAAQHAACDFIVTRDPKGFRGSPVRHLTPEALLPLLGQAPNQP